MATDPKIENYLATLEGSLKLLPVSDRAEIVTEIKSHILSAMERDPNATIESVLSALGEPQTVANRYLMERGHTLNKPPVSPIFKWIVIGCLGALGMSLLFVGVLVFKFSPLIKVDEGKDKDHVTLLGGLIDVDGATDVVKIGGLMINGDESQIFAGSKALPADDKRAITIKGSNAKMSIENSEKSEFRWDCKIGKNRTAPFLQEENQQLVLDMSDMGGEKCTFKIPEKHKLSLTFTNGKVVVEKPHYDLDISGNNGKISLAPDSVKNYTYQIQIHHGALDDFESSTQSDAYQIHIHLENGRISRSED